MTQPPPLIDALRRMAGPGPDGRSDAELLAAFVGGDAAAFAVLVQRHGRLVWGACRRRTTDSHTAEDAFQTTFLALARNAGSVRKPGALAAWLHRVAVRCTAALRTPREPMSALPNDLPSREPGPGAAAEGRDLERVIDAEIDALPEPYRLAFVMCEVEDQSTAAAAAALGCAVGTVESRLTRARERLRARLARRGVTAGALVGLGLAVDAVPAAARSAAVALGTGAAPVPVGRAALADQAARMPVAGAATVGIGLAGAVMVAGLGGLVWALAGGPEPAAPSPPLRAVPVPQVDIPAAEQFRRNRQNFPLPAEAVARVGDPWLRHAATPDRLAYSADGRFLAAAAPGDRWLRVWDLTAGRPRAHLRLGPGDRAVALGLTPDGGTLRAVVRVPGGAQLREYDTFRAEEVHRRPVPDPAAALFDPTAAYLTLTRPGELLVVNVATGFQRWRVGLAGSGAADLAVAGADRVAVVLPDADRVSLYDLATGDPAGELVEPGRPDGPPGHNRVALPAFSADGRTMAVWLPLQDKVRVWDVTAHRAVHTIAPPYPATALAMSPDGSRVAVFTTMRGAALWDARAPAKPQQVNAFGGKGGQFSPDGATLAVLAGEPGIGTVQIVDAKTGGPKSAVEPQGPLPLAFGPGGDRLLLEGVVRWLDWPTAGDDPPQALAPWATATDRPSFDVAEWAALSADHSVMAKAVTANGDKGEFALDLLDAGTRARRLRIPLERVPRRPAFAPDGRTVYAVVSNVVRGWDVATGREVVRGSRPAGELVYRLAVSPDGRYLATAVLVLTDFQRAGSIQVWDAATGQSVIEAEAGDRRPFIAFSADGKRFAAAAVPDRPVQHVSEIRVWDLASRTVTDRFAGYDGQPAFAPDGRTLAVTRDDRVELIEFASGQVRHVFQHHGPVEPALAWRADGRVLAAASPEAPVYLWDVAGDRTGTTPEWDPARDRERWAALAGPDAVSAFGAIRQAWAHPAEAAAYLQARVPADADARLAARACEALELPGAAAGKKVLAEWAAGPPAAPRTREAADTLRRLAATDGRGRG